MYGVTVDFIPLFFVVVFRVNGESIPAERLDIYCVTERKCTGVLSAEAEVYNHWS